ncbi:apolipoprotein N-acyltransferase [Parafrigoribacterium mesophilum]|uniref:apolipoprotein N-acyltransferase n=1 Tax=Parafrigoribacterium mesophilum TaxID=433646 RepID=UPI0031FE3C5E
MGRSRARLRSAWLLPAALPARWRSAVRGPALAAPKLWLACVTAAAAGIINAAAFPDLGWWPLVIPGTALMLWSLRARRAGGGFLVGLIGGFAFFGTHIFWLTVYLGPVPWLALAGLQSVFFGFGAMLMALAWRTVPALWPGRIGRLLLLPLVLAGLWTLREAITSVWPYGGFSWGRLAFSQSASPLGHLVAWIGISGLSFVLAALAAIALQALLEVRLSGLARAIAVVAAFAVVAVVPAWPVASSGSFRVAAVQGASDAGLFAQHQPGQTLQDHLRETIPLIGETVDLVVWPENAADIDPLRDGASARALDRITADMNAPLVTGTITEDARGRLFNSLLLWKSGEGAVAQYDKIHPVPFAEYLPDRQFWYPFAPSLFDLVPRDYAIGTRPNVFDINHVLAGVAICFDIVDDGLIHQMIDTGAQVILAPTNNADFGHTDESVQQLAIARLRAMETSRSVVNISTVGTSAIIAPDGSTIAALPTWTPGSMVETVPLSDAITPAMMFGRELEWLLTGLSFAALVVATVVDRRRLSVGRRSGGRRG